MQTLSASLLTLMHAQITYLYCLFLVFPNPFSLASINQAAAQSLLALPTMNTPFTEHVSIEIFTQFLATLTTNPSHVYTTARSKLNVIKLDAQLPTQPSSGLFKGLSFSRRTRATPSASYRYESKGGQLSIPPLRMCLSGMSDILKTVGPLFAS